MTFASVQTNQAINKFLLARMNPARYLNDLLAGPSAGIYTYTAPVLLNSIEEQGSALTKVTGTPTSGQWSQDESTLVVSVYPAGAPSSSNAIVGYYYLYVTTEKNRVIREDPTSSTDDFRDWEPKIKFWGGLSASVRNVLQGILSISSSSLTIINDSHEIEGFLTDNDSFFQKTIDIWLCLDDVSNIKAIFSGKMTAIEVRDTTYIVRYEDNLSNIAEPALMGDDSQYTYFNLQDYANLNPFDNNKAIPFFFGTLSRYTTEYESVTNLADAQKLAHRSLYLAACTNYTSNISTSVNREWGLGRVSSDGFLDFTHLPSAVDNSDPNFTRFTSSAANVAKMHIGDTFAHNSEYARVYYVDRTNNYIYTTKLTSPSAAQNIEGNNAPSVTVDDGTTTYYPMYGRDYTASVSATTGGNKYAKITFVNNFEATVGVGTLDPTVMQVGFRVKPDITNAKHGSVVNSLLTAAGVTVNSASVTTANSTLAVNCNFSIPYFDEIDYKNYYEYLEDILKSTLGYLRLNDDFEIEYNLFATPSSSDSHTSTEIIKDSFRINIDYKDIVTKIIGFNPHYSAEEIVSQAATPSVTKSNNKAEYLHGINRTTRFRHVLEDMTSRLQDIIDVRSERTALYYFQTANKNMDSLLGDNVQLEIDGILGNVATEDVTLLSINKQFERTSMIATDLLNL